MELLAMFSDNPDKNAIIFFLFGWAVLAFLVGSAVLTGMDKEEPNGTP